MPSSQMTFQFLAEPTDVNFGGKVHGGMVMKWIESGGLRLRSSVEWSLLCDGIG